MDWDLGVSRCKLLYWEWISNEVLLYTGGNYTQSLVMECDGRKYEKKNIYIPGSLCCTGEIHRTL